MTIYVNIGSNQGDRHALIEQAVALIVSHWSPSPVRRSRYVESEPWGYDSPNKFLNLGIAIDAEGAVNPFDTLHSLQAIEHSISPTPHRNPDGTYADRLIDIDLIAIDNLRIDTPELTLPHPRAHLRPFVTIPLSDLGFPLSLLC